MTTAELLIAEELLKANPDALPLVEQWMTEKLESNSLRVLKIRRDAWDIHVSRRPLTLAETLLYGLIASLIDQAEAEE